MYLNFRAKNEKWLPQVGIEPGTSGLRVLLT